MPAVGSPAPAFRLSDHTGTERTLEGYRGKRVVLWFFPKADTPGCTLEGCGFRDRSAGYAAKGAAILGISFDSVEANRAFAEKHGFVFPLLCDTSGAVGRAYGVAPPGQTFPRRATFVIGPTGVIEQVIPQVDPKSHPDALLATLPDAR
jgi:peroxiredoxin Q/BCP